METLDSYSAPSGFKFIGLTKDGGTWGKFVERTDSYGSSESRDDLKLKRKQRQAAQKQEQAEKIAGEMKAEERDRQYRKMLLSLRLNEVDRADLIRRGLTLEEIKAGWFRSVERWQKLSSRYSKLLPGISQYGRSLVVGQGGYLCPVFDVEGRIVACQIRLRGEVEGGRYRWLSSVTRNNPNGATSHLNSEMPIQVARPIKGNVAPFIGMAEGTSPKPFIAAQRLGSICIGAAGGNFIASKKVLKATLKQLSAELGTKTIRFCPDAGAIKNLQVLKQYRRTWKQATKWGYEVLIGWWNQFDKEDGDIDELNAEQRKAIEYISIEQFNEIAGSTEQIRGNAKELKIQAELNGMRLKPTAVFSDRYIPKGSGRLPKEGGGQLIDIFMGGGKTESWLASVIAEHRQKYPDAQIYMIGSRNLLLSQSCKKLKLTHIHSMARGIGEKHKSWGGCYDSVGQIDPASIPPNSLIILDEIEAGFMHLLTSDTLKNNRPFILQRTKEIFQTVIRLNGFLVGLEDGISNIALDFLLDLTGLQDSDIELFTSDWKADGSRTYTVWNSQSGTQEEIALHVQRGEGLVIASDVRKWVRETETRMLEMGVSPDEMLVIDSSTSNDPIVREFAEAEKSREWLDAHPQIKYILYTPSAESGISIEHDRFKGTGYHFVNLPARSCKQMVERLRNDGHRFGSIHDSNNVGSFDPDKILDDLYKNAEGIAKLTEIADYIAKVESEQTGQPLNSGAKLKQLLDRANSEYTFYLKHWARFEARANYERANRSALLTDHWKQRGHTVLNAKLTLSEEEWEERKEERERIREQNDRKVSEWFSALDVPHIDRASAELTLNDRKATYEERTQALKYIMAENLPGCDFNNPEFVFKAVYHNHGSFRKGTELLWAIQNPEQARHIDRLSLAAKITRAAKFNEVVWTPGVRLQSLKAELISRSPLLECITAETYTNDSEQVKKLHDWVDLHKDEIWRVLRLKPGETPVETANKLLKRIGYKAEEIERKGSRGDRKRGYRIVNFEDQDRDAILAALDQRFIDKHGKLYQQVDPVVIEAELQPWEPALGDRVILQRDNGGERLEGGVIVQMPAPSNINCYMLRFPDGDVRYVFNSDRHQMALMASVADSELQHTKPQQIAA